jgi:rRNA small subunit pseudouridine methyltransferase Nep1
MEEATVASLPKTEWEKETAPRLIVILEGANLETVKRGHKFELLNADDHSKILRKHDRDLNDARPDITHQCLLQLMDSPLNKVGKLQIFIHTKRGVLIEINPQTRIPRTFKRFAGLMVQLLDKLSIRAVDGPTKLLKVIKNPVTMHLPGGVRKVGLEADARLVDISEWVLGLPKDQPVVFVIGAFAHGNISVPYVEEQISVSSFPLSAAVVCSKLTTAFERHWGVL